MGFGIKTPNRIMGWDGQTRKVKKKYFFLYFFGSQDIFQGPKGVGPRGQ